MKKIKIIFDNQIETLTDEDESSLEEYTKMISPLFISGNVNIVHTAKESLLVRPSKVIAVKVTDETTSLEEKNTEVCEDTITD